MELQWPLIIFTTLTAWAAGTFASQCALALGGQGKKSQTALWATAAVLLVVGGVAVFFHLEHWERIFNGFGNPTSGITQELVCIVVLAVVAVIYLVLQRRSEGGLPAKWVSVVGIVASALLVAVMAHSYLMAARPAWDSFPWILYVLGNACVLGPLTAGVVLAVRGDDLKLAGLIAVVGSAVNAVLAVVYAFSLQAAGSAFSAVGYHFDPTAPNQGLVDAAAAADVMGGDNALVLWLGAIAVGALIPVACAVFAKLKGDAGNWKAWGAVGIACAVIGCVCMRVVFYNVGLSVFAFY